MHNPSIISRNFDLSACVFYFSNVNIRANNNGLIYNPFRNLTYLQLGIIFHLKSGAKVQIFFLLTK